MQKLRFVLSLIDSINDKAGKIIHWLIVPMFAIVVFEVFMRYGLNAPTKWAYETTMFVFATYIILAGGYTFLHRAHVNVDVVYSRFSLRVRAILDLVTSIFFFLFCIVLLWKGWEFAWLAVQVQQTAGTPWDPPIYPVKLMIPLGAFLILLQGSAKFTRDLITAITGGKPE